MANRQSDFRIETDSLGDVQVPLDKLWGAQTERSRVNFKIGSEKIPTAVILAFAQLKRATAIVNHKNGNLDTQRKNAIVASCDEILTGEYAEQFPLVTWQTGSGTQSNMNLNEVIAHLANQKLLETDLTVHPNDHVNMSQSSNDTFPTAMNIAAYDSIIKNLLPECKKMIATLEEKEEKYHDLIKIGRTHLQDATPLTFAQEISGWKIMLQKGLNFIEDSSQNILELAIGGTAVGTGLNAPLNFGEDVAYELSIATGHPFISAPNKFYALTSHSDLSYTHGAIRSLASDLMKIANDIRWLASGPRSGIGEITLPANEPGSSIMPGKVNPTQAEALTMVVAQVMGNDVTITVAASQGNFELNVYKPVIILNFLQSVTLLSDAMRSFRVHCLVGLEANQEAMSELVKRSLMLVTALSPHIGYEKSATIAKKALAENLTLKEAALALKYVSDTEFDLWVDTSKMVHP
ncbi:class II fumarate hydratase [Carnobacterium gallinarum]|uniref:class II fumarate hydratase n=1 Tax=Carnobacterium gallinarum TaxID=2749 RepID=UPI0005561759|nr:class II fumarate hydratase [Carnobacterium gallinarum]